MKKVVLVALMLGAGCLGSYKAPAGSGQGSQQPGSSTGGGSSSGGGGSSNAGSSADLGSTPAPADMATAMPTPSVDAGTPTSATPSCDLLVDCCQGDPDCAAQFDNLSEDVCAGLLAAFQSQGACL